MVKVNTFLYCEAIQGEITPQGTAKTTLINPLQVIRPLFIPSMFSFAIFVGLQEYNVLEPHTFRFILENSSTGEGATDTGIIAIPVQPNVDDFQKEIGSIMLNMEFKNAILRNEGSYIGKIYIDGVECGIYPIYVKAVENK